MGLIFPSMTNRLDARPGWLCRVEMSAWPKYIEYFAEFARGRRPNHFAQICVKPPFVNLHYRRLVTLGPFCCLASDSVVGSIGLASEVTLLPVPTTTAPTQIKCANNSFRYRGRRGKHSVVRTSFAAYEAATPSTTAGGVVSILRQVRYQGQGGDHRGILLTRLLAEQFAFHPNRCQPTS